MVIHLYHYWIQLTFIKFFFFYKTRVVFGMIFSFFLKRKIWITFNTEKNTWPFEWPIWNQKFRNVKIFYKKIFEFAKLSASCVFALLCLTGLCAFMHYARYSSLLLTCRCALRVFTPYMPYSRALSSQATRVLFMRITRRICAP